jgi:hypothetical protein
MWCLSSTSLRSLGKGNAKAQITTLHLSNFKHVCMC